MEDQGNSVYELSCNDYEAVYFGETSRTLADRKREQRGLSHKIPKNMVDFENLERSSAIALHAIEHSHNINFEQPESLLKNWYIYRERIAVEQ